MANKSQKCILTNKEFTSMLKEQILRHGKVKVRNLGVFELKEMSGRKGFNPGTKILQDFPPFIKINFVPTKKFKELMQTYGN